MAATVEERRCRRPSRAAKAAILRALRGARDLYVRGVRGFGRLVAAGNPRAGAGGRPTSRVFGVGGLGSDQDLAELLRAMQARRRVGAGYEMKQALEAAAAVEPAVGRVVAAPLERIDEDAAMVVHPAK